MSKRSIFVATENKKAIEFLINFFADTQSIPTILRSKQDFSEILLAGSELVFFESEWLDERLTSRLAPLKTKSKAKWFGLGQPKIQSALLDAVLDFPLEDKQLQRAIFSKMELPSKIKLAVVDDEVDIGEMIRDYFEGRKDPEFEVRTGLNGLEGFKLISEFSPHCIVLDIKMPVRTGVELYRDLMKSGRKIPTIIFIDSTAADDILEIRKWGNPAFVEKGGHHSSMPEMLSLVKKQIAFS